MPRGNPKKIKDIELVRQVLSPGGPFEDEDYPDEPCYWVITEDAIDCGRVGYHNMPEDIAEDFDTLKWQPFRTYDDDMNLYYSGWFTSIAFQPIDFARADAGAVHLKYKHPRTHKWETL